MKNYLGISILIIFASLSSNAQYFETGIFLKYGKELTSLEGEVVTNPVTGNSFTFSSDDSLVYRREPISVGYSIARSLPKSFRWMLYLGAEKLTFDDGTIGFNELPQYTFHIDWYNLRSELTFQKYFFRGFLYGGLGISNQQLIFDNSRTSLPSTSDATSLSDFYFLNDLAQPAKHNKTYLKAEFGAYIGEIKMLKISTALNCGFPGQNVIRKSEVYFEFGIGMILGDRTLTKNKNYNPPTR